MPTPAVAILRTYSSLAQSVEHAAVNRRVVRSSRTGGAKAPPCILSAAFFQRVFSSVGQSPRLITGWSRVRVPEDPPNRKDACWRLFYLAGLGERRPFYRFSSRCPDLTQRGNRNGSPFTLPPPCGGEKPVRGWWRFFCCNNESLPWWEAFSIREYYLRGMCGGVGAGGGPAGPAAAGGRTRPKAAEPAPAGAGCPAGHRVGLLRGRGGGQYLRRSGDVITLIRSMHFT